MIIPAVVEHAQDLDVAVNDIVGRQCLQLQPRTRLQNVDNLAQTQRTSLSESAVVSARTCGLETENAKSLNLDFQFVVRNQREISF